MASNRRKYRNLLINKQVQGVFALFIVMSVLLVALIVGGEIMRSLQLISGMPVGQEALSKANIFFISKVIVLLVWGCIVVGLLSVFVSHKLVGPVFRLSDCMLKLFEGKLYTRAYLRKKDFFKDVAHIFNRMAEQFEGHYMKDISDLKETHDLWKELTGAAEEEHTDIQRIKDITSKIGKKLDVLTKRKTTFVKEAPAVPEALHRSAAVAKKTTDVVAGRI